MQNHNMPNRSAGWRYLLLALYAFAGLGIEALYAFLLEPMIYGIQMQDWSAAQNISHWIITCITWGIIAFSITRYVKKKYDKDIFTKKEKMKGWQWVAVIFCLLITLIISIIDWNGFKVLKEFQYNGLLKFIFQYIYYFFETALFLLIIVLGQRAFEIWTKIANYPFGGLLCAITWGLVHILTKGSIEAGLLTALSSILFGTVFLLTNRDIRRTYVIILLMFIL